MKNTTLNFYERLVLSEIIGLQEGRLADISAYLRILDKVRLSDDERRASNLRLQGDQLQWKLPEERFGELTTEFEDEEARRLTQLLETWPKVTLRDAPWIARVVDDLRREPLTKVCKRAQSGQRKEKV